MPKSGEFLLDTNAIIAMMGKDSALEQKLTPAKSYLPNVAIGELYFGALKSANVERNVQRVETLITGGNLLFCDIHTASIYGVTKQTLRSKGKPIPDNDAWITAVAMQHKLVLATRDAHFNHVQGLMTLSW